MKIETTVKKKIGKDLGISVIIYLLPIVLMFVWFYYKGEKPWLNTVEQNLAKSLENIPKSLHSSFLLLKQWGLYLFAIILWIFEVAHNLYDKKVWTKNEKTLDIVCFVTPKILFIPILLVFHQYILPFLFPGGKNIFIWVPFWWGIFIIAIADDLTQYWYHRLHHQVPFLWKFHRTHHSAPYMGMAMASRQNFIYTVFFSHIYLIAIFTYFGLGLPALFVGALKTLITMAAHSSLKWDKPLYKYKLLHPLAWVVERTISTPATHHAHHADTDKDGIGHYKGNFGNMFFIWDMIFGTGVITRQYPKSYGIKSYKGEEWYVQFLYPIFKSKNSDSSLSK